MFGFQDQDVELSVDRFACRAEHNITDKGVIILNTFFLYNKGLKNRISQLLTGARAGK
jgi:hypothetical protein